MVPRAPRALPGSVFPEGPLQECQGMVTLCVTACSGSNSWEGLGQRAEHKG